jgi:hypothetical protein
MLMLGRLTAPPVLSQFRRLLPEDSLVRYFQMETKRAVAGGLVFLYRVSEELTFQEFRILLRNINSKLLSELRGNSWTSI